MHPGTGVRITGLLVSVGVWLLATAPASATTFCVPTFHAACPSGAGGVQQASLETAMQTNGDDGNPDAIIVAPTTVSNADSYEILSGDNDPLEIVGAGPDQTVATSTQSGNQFVFNLNGPRDVTMRDLTIRVPATMMDNLGGAMQSEQDTFENVDIESRNVRSDGIVSAIGGSTFVDGAVYGSNGGSIDTGFSGNGAETGTLEIRRTTIDSPSWGINSDDPEVTVFARRVRITDPLAYGVRITDGAFLVFENGIISDVTTGYPVIAESNDPGTVIATVRHTTIDGTPSDPNDPAVRAAVQNAAGNGPVNLVVSDSIIAGFENPLNCEAPVSPTIGNASLTVRYSYFFHSAVISGDCNFANPPPNSIDAFTVGAPQFAGPGDYHLLAGSPAIDVGDPLTAALPTEDYDGAPRPVDGNADGIARRDMGAFEYQPPVPPGGGGGPDAPADPGPQDPVPVDPGDPEPLDDSAPVISKLRFKRGLSESDGGTLKVRLSEAASLRVSFRESGGGKRGNRAVKLSYAASGGRNKLKVRRGKLNPGAYRVKALATDVAGNRSAPARTRVIVAP
jgi:hypothetical protein